MVWFYAVPRTAPAVPLPELEEAEPALQRSSACPTPTLLPGRPVARAHGASRTGTGMAELRQKSRARAKGCLESARPPLHRDSLLPPFHRTRNRNRSRTSLGHFSFPICFSTFLSLSRSSCSPSPAVSTGTGWKQGSNRSDRLNHLLMSSVPGVGGKPLPRRSCPWPGGTSH